MTQSLPLSGFIRHGALRERLIVSLDLGGLREGLKLVDQLSRTVGMFKVGKALYKAGGPDFVRDIRRRGAEVFLDLKFHDTPCALVRAALEATRLGVRMFDLHLSGCAVEWAERVRNEVGRLCHHEGLRRPHMLAVAMLAEASRASQQGVPESAIDGVLEVAKNAAQAGLDGVLTSFKEVPGVRAACGRRFIIATFGAQAHDGANCTPGGVDAAGAIRAGADYLIVGRPIWRADEPARAVREIIDQIDRGLRAPSLLSRETIFSREQ
jgi:orotidine-5'-phosphate decarboxylase